MSACRASTPKVFRTLDLLTPSIKNVHSQSPCLDSGSGRGRPIETTIFRPTTPCSASIRRAITGPRSNRLGLPFSTLRGGRFSRVIIPVRRLLRGRIRKYRVTSSPRKIKCLFVSEASKSDTMRGLPDLVNPCFSRYDPMRTTSRNLIEVSRVPLCFSSPGCRGWPLPGGGRRRPDQTACPGRD